MKKMTDDIKLQNELVKYKRYCRCGHSVIITPTAKYNKVLCSWCNQWIFKNDLEMFKYYLKKLLK